MGHIIADLKETFRRGNIFIQLIYINVGIFLIGTLINVFLRLFEVSTSDIFGIFALPASFIGFMHQPWSLFTYMFMPASCIFYSICSGCIGSEVCFSTFSRPNI